MTRLYIMEFTQGDRSTYVCHKGGVTNWLFDRKQNLVRDLESLRRHSPSSLPQEFRDFDNKIKVEIPYVSVDLPKDLCLSLEIALFNLFDDGLKKLTTSIKIQTHRKLKKNHKRK